MDLVLKMLLFLLLGVGGIASAVWGVLVYVEWYRKLNEKWRFVVTMLQMSFLVAFAPIGWMVESLQLHTGDNWIMRFMGWLLDTSDIWKPLSGVRNRFWVSGYLLLLALAVVRWVKPESSALQEALRK